MVWLSELYQNLVMSQAEEITQQETRSKARSGFTIPLIGCTFIAVVAALFIGLEVFGVISGILFPPDPPLPPNIQRVEQQNQSFGVDVWSYTTADSPCSVISYYERNQSTCTLTGDYCEGTTFNSPGYSLESVATCIGTDEYSVFGLRWTVQISTRVRQGAETTNFTVQREILWSGPAPQSTSTGG